MNATASTRLERGAKQVLFKEVVVVIFDAIFIAAKRRSLRNLKIPMFAMYSLSRLKGSEYLGFPFRYDKKSHDN
jgi:hypothetical protein